MLRKLKVNVNGKEYLVELEEIGGPAIAPAAAPMAAAPAAAAPAPAPAAAAAAPAAAPAPVVTGAGITIESPMPGNILAIKVKVGDQVEEEQPLVILEAMKMENELVAPKAGTVTAIHVTANSPVDVGQPIITIE